MKKFTPPINQILFFTLKSCIIPLIITNGLKKNHKQLISNQEGNEDLQSEKMLKMICITSNVFRLKSNSTKDLLQNV